MWWKEETRDYGGELALEGEGLQPGVTALWSQLVDFLTPRPAFGWNGFAGRAPLDLDCFPCYSLGETSVDF